MEFKFFVLSFLLSSVAFSQGKTWLQNDAVIIDAIPDTNSRVRSPRYAELTSGGFNAFVTSTECRTTRGRQGHCQPIKDCYPVLFPLNKTVPFKGTLNPELTNILIESSGVCDHDYHSLQRKSQREVYNQVLASEFLVCCPAPRQEQGPGSDNFQTVPAPQPLAAQRSCGGAQVQIVNSTNKVNGTKESDRIVGGREAAIGEFPWIVALMNRGREFCGGSLISDSWVLTAAHCIQHMTSSDVANLRIQIGDHDIYNPNEVKSETRTAVKVLYHKGFTMERLRDDIGLIKLSSPVQSRKGIQTICRHSGSLIDNVIGDIAGWGQLCEGCQQPSKLRATQVKIIPYEECRKKYESVIGITRNMVCAGGEGKDSCRGDSGGPLSINSKTNPELAGLVSFGVECGSQPGVYTRVSAYRDWIDKNAQ